MIESLNIMQDGKNSAACNQFLPELASICCENVGKIYLVWNFEDTPLCCF
jgi:hypothetical protein